MERRWCSSACLMPRVRLFSQPLGCEPPMWMGSQHAQDPDVITHSWCHAGSAPVQARIADSRNTCASCTLALPSQCILRNLPWVGSSKGHLVELRRLKGQSSQLLDEMI